MNPMYAIMYTRGDRQARHYQNDTGKIRNNIGDDDDDDVVLVRSCKRSSSSKKIRKKQCTFQIDNAKKPDIEQKWQLPFEKLCVIFLFEN